MQTSRPTPSPKPPRASRRARFKLALATLAAAAALQGGAYAPALAGDQIEIEGPKLKAIGASSLKKMHYTTLLTHAKIRADLEVLLQHLNTSDPNAKLRTDGDLWSFGPAVPKGFRFTANAKSLDLMLKRSSKSAFGRYMQIRVKRNGVVAATRTVEAYFFDIAPRRIPGKPYTACIMVMKDIKSGSLIGVHSFVRQFENLEATNLHEFAPRDGKPVRLSNSKSETTILQTYSVVAGISKKSANHVATRTLAAAQKAPSIFSQISDLYTKDAQKSVNQIIGASVTVSTAEQETDWWNQFKDEALKAIKDLGRQLAAELLEYAKDYLKDIKAAAADWLKDLVDDLICGFKRLFGYSC